MESSEKFQKKFQDFARSIARLEKLSTTDFSLLNEDTREIYENALIQKFEICAELSWKLIRRFLEEKAVLNVRAPKDCIKQFYVNGFCSEDLYEGLIKLIEDRNLMSHIYYEGFFQSVLQHIPKHVESLIQLSSTMEQHLQNL